MPYALCPMPYDPEQRIHNPGIKLCAGAPNHLARSFRDRASLAVRPLTRHRMKRVARAHDAGAERDVLAGQTVGIAAAVPALVC
jgi:hypothetical protein